MQTNFSLEQLKDKDNKSSEKFSENVFIVVFVTQHVLPINY